MNNSEKKNIKRVSKFVFSKWIHFTLTSPLSYRETLPTRSIDVDLTFIVDEQRLSIKNVLETNNDFGETEKDDSNGKESLVHTRVTSIEAIDSRSIHGIHVRCSRFGKNFNPV